MEAHYEDMRRGRTTLDKDPSMRMPQRPRAKGQAYEDFGSDFSSGSKQYTKNTNGSKRPGSRPDFDTSIDELDFLSQPSTDVEETSGRRPSRTKSRDEPIKGVGFLVDGEVHKAAEGYEVDGREKLKGLSFKKIKAAAPKTSQEDSVVFASKPEPKVTRNTPRLPVSDALNKPFRPPTRINRGEGSSKPAALPRRSPSPSFPSLSPSWLKDSDTEDTPRPSRVRPTTRTVSLGTKRAAAERKPPSSVKEEKGKARLKPAGFPIPLTETSNSKTKPSAPAKFTKAPFPMDLPSSTLRENSKDAASKKRRPLSPPFGKVSPQSSQGSKRTVSGGTNTGPVDRTRKQVAEVPFEDMLAASSQDSKRSGSSKLAPRRPAEFPSISPIRKNSKPKPKPRAKVSQGTVYSSEDTEDDSTRPKAQPFPMATQMLETLGPNSAKRGSSSPASGSDSDDRRRERKRARGADEIMRELMYSDGLDGEEDEAALFMDPDLDPTRLCPWCDELLPPAPSPHLQHLINVARARSVKDARPTNPLGLHADAAVLVNVCHRHRFEHKQIPLAHERGWPTQIEWAKLGSRVRRHELRLQLLVDDVDEEFLPGNERQKEDDINNGDDDNYGGGDDESLLPTRPRKGSAFWLEVVRNVKKKGIQKAAGVRGQMSNFNKTQPGYYGELGSVIISQTIYDLFPPASFPADSTLPLTPTEFIQGILVPEAALALVMEDMHQTRQEALRTLRDSAQYGVAMFPDDAREGKSASEAIIKARAAVRREELLREEQLEADAEEDALWENWSDSALREVIDAQTTAPESSQSRPRRECAKRAAPIVDSSDSDVSMTSVRSKRAKSKKPASRRPAKAQPAASDAIELSDTPSLSKPLSRASRAKARAASSASEAKSDAIELSDAPSLTQPRPRPRPKQKTTAYGVDARSSDIEAPSSSNPAMAQVTFGARGEMHKRVQRDDGSFETLDLERTPKAKKRAAAGTFPLMIARASRAPPAGGSTLSYPLDDTSPYDLTYPLDDDL